MTPANLTTAQTPDTAPWVPELPPTDLPYDDGEPLESNRHRIGMNVLIEGLEQAWRDRDDFFAGGNMFIYYSLRQARNVDFRGPDFFAVVGVERERDRRYWAVWDEDGRYPDVIVELMSPSTAKIDREDKKDLYERTFHTRNYFIYNPYEPDSLQGWRLSNGRYEPITPNERGWLWCDALELWLGLWQGTILREPAPWLRFYTADGELVLLGTEEAALERQRAEAEFTRAEEERQRAEAEFARAEEERQRAEAEFARAEEERQRAEAAQAEMQVLLDKLRARGIDPDQL